MEYNFNRIEKDWQSYWAQNKTFRAENNSKKPKYYVLDMFPYPSGAGLHVGHPLGYIASDIVARYKRLNGYNVLHPMGYDSFGLPAEQYAIQTGQHPAITTEINTKKYREQLDQLGFSFDWDREVKTSDPAYYKWTQWIFIQLFNSWYNKEAGRAEAIETLIKQFETSGSLNEQNIVTGNIEQEYTPFTAKDWSSFSEKKQQEILGHYRLAYLSDAMVNWCPELGTVLANEEVKDGVSERGGFPVERKLMKQWSLRITDYAERLLKDLDNIDWSDSIKEAQRNWIGKSEGCSIFFDIQNSAAQVEVFTTRPDTIFGVSFITLAPEHDLVEKITTPEQKQAVKNYTEVTKSRSERERMADVKKISGEFTGAYALHPFTGKQIPIWIGDYVLAGYGTGAVMAVPAHDSRDYAFAKNFQLPIIEVVSGGKTEEAAYEEKEGLLINSDFLNGLSVKEAIHRAIQEIEKTGKGKGKTNYKLRDAVFGRQRYWGEPIPIYYKGGIPYAVEEKDLPVELPVVDKFLPTETGEPPLARAKDWKYKGEYEYETTTMPGWAGSSWYYLRYMDSKNENEFVSKKVIEYWQNIDLYIGGAEHATGHLLYIRFWTKFLYDLGYLPFTEPAKKLINQGMIQGISHFITEVMIDPKEKKNYDNQEKELELIIKNGNEELYRLPYITLEGKHIYVSVDCGFNFSFYDPKEQKEINAFLNTHHAKIKYINNSSLQYDLWVEEEKQYKPILITNKGFWKWNIKSWIDFKNKQKTLVQEFKTKPEVEKMSKSKLNVVTPDNICAEYGADCLRLYEMFLGPLEQHKPWNTNGISGVFSFLKKLWRLYHSTGSFFVSEEAPNPQELKALHKTIKKVQEDIDRFSFNTSVSSFMICVNELSDLKCYKRSILEPLAIIISPYAPHIAEELWKLLGHNESISYALFPEWKQEFLTESTFNYPVSFNGKTRFFLELDRSLNKEEIEKEVMAQEQTQKYLEEKSPKKVIIVPNKIVNIVV